MSATATPPPPSPIIAVIGSLTHDLIFTVPRMPARGESANATGLTGVHGGKGANMAIAAHRASHRRPSPASHPEGRPSPPPPSSSSLADREHHAGEIRVFMNGTVGDDGVGAVLRDALAETGVDVSGVRIREGAKTGQAVVVLEPDEGGYEDAGSRCLAFKGANGEFELPVEGLKGLAGGTGEVPDLVILHLTMAMRAVEETLTRAAAMGVEVVLSASPAVELRAEMYACVTHLLVNEHEAAALAGVGAVTDLEDDGVLAKVAEGFVKLGARNVVITLGEAGAYFATREGDHGRVAAQKGVKVVDTTGAGDTFVGAYAVDYIRQKQRGEWDIRKAAIFASKASARTIEQIGAQTAMPWLEDI